MAESRPSRPTGTRRDVARSSRSRSKLCEGLSKPRTQKRIDKVWQRIGRLKAQSRGVAQHYDVELATAVRFISMMTHPGVYCLRSNADLEAVFRSLNP